MDCYQDNKSFQYEKTTGKRRNLKLHSKNFTGKRNNKIWRKERRDFNKNQIARYILNWMVTNIPHRLQFEVTQFIKDVQSTAEQKDSKTEPVNPAEIAQQLAVLQNQLINLMQNDQTRAAIDPTHFFAHHSLMQADLSQKLISEIQSVKPTTEGSSKPDPKDKVTYELYYTPDQAKYVQANRLVDLEKRVASVEELVGVPAITGSSGSAPPTSAPLASIVGELRDKVSLLDGPRFTFSYLSFSAHLLIFACRLEGLLQKIRALMPQIESLAKSAQDRGPVQDKKIGDIYDMMTKWDAVAQQLPTLVSRMVL